MENKKVAGKAFELGKNQDLTEHHMMRPCLTQGLLREDGETKLTM